MTQQIFCFEHLLSVSKDEFLLEFRNYDNKAKEIFFHEVFMNIFISIKDSHVEDLKNQNKLISYAENEVSPQTLQKYYSRCDNSICATNFIIVASKYDSIDSLNYLFEDGNHLLSVNVGNSLSPETVDDEQHNAFYYAIRSNNVRVLKLLCENWPDNYFSKYPDKLDDLLSEAYNEIKLKNLEITDETRFLIEQLLLEKRFFHMCSNCNTMTTVMKIKERANYVVIAANMFATENVIAKSVYILKFIAKNIFVLKQQLGFLYVALPFEEIEFCLLSFITTIVKQNIHLWNTILTKSKILSHLKNFCNSLDVELSGISNDECERKLAIRPRIKRDNAISDILKKRPYFRDLYSDYNQIRDMYSLQIIRSYEELVLSTYSKKYEWKYTVFKFVQILGENIKNSLTCPNLSNALKEKLNSSLPENCENLFPTLRDAWFHGNQLTMCKERETYWNDEFFSKIQKEILSVNEVITALCFEEKYQITRTLLEQILNCNSLNEANEYLELLNNLKWCGTISEFPKLNVLERLNSIITDLRFEIDIKTYYENECFSQITNIVELLSDKFKLFKFDYALLFSFKSLFQESLSIKSDLKCLHEVKSKAEKLLKYFNKWEFENLEVIVENTKKIFYSCSRRLPKLRVKNIRMLVNEVCRIVQMETKPLKCISSLQHEFRKTRYNEKVKTQPQHEKELQVKKGLMDILQCLSEFINTCESHKNSNMSVIEVILSDLLAMFDEHHFTNNNCYIDSPFPILIGKNLRNHLAHGNVINDVLFHTSMSTYLNAQKVISTGTEHRMDKIIINDTFKLKKRLYKDLHSLSIQNNFFEALMVGDFRVRDQCIKKGADINARNEQLWTSLHYASKGSSEEMVLFVLERMSSVSVKDINGQTPLHIAASFGNECIVETLITHGISIDDMDYNKRTALHIAAQCGRVKVVQCLLKYNADKNVKDKFLSTPLQIALLNGYIDIIKELSKGEYLDQIIFSQGFTPLHIAAKLGYVDLVDFLLNKNKVNVNVFNDENETPLHHAAECGYLEIVTLLISAKANVDAKNVYNRTPLYEAVQYGHVNVVKILLKQGAEVNCQDILNITPLQLAACFGHLNIVEVLLNHKSSIDAVDAEGMTAFHFSALYSHLAVIELLIENNAVCIADANGRTALELILMKGDRNLVNLFITSGVNLTHKYSGGKSILHLAVEHGTSEIVQLLIEEGAVDCKDDIGWYALHYCYKHSDPDIAKLLMCNGSDINEGDIYKITPLHLASEIGNCTLISAFIKISNEMNKLIDFNAPTKHGFTPLHFSAQGNHVETIKILLKNGAKIDMRDSSGDTPLCVAVNNNFMEVVQLLVSRGSDVNANGGEPLRQSIQNGYINIVEFLLQREEINLNIEHGFEHPSPLVFDLDELMEITDSEFEEGKTALQLAVLSGSPTIVELLVHKGMRVNYSTAPLYFSPLHIASSLGKTEIVSILLRNGADVDILNESEATPLHIAAQGYNCVEVIQILLNHKANPYIRDRTNTTPIEYAVLSGHLEAVKILIDSLDPSFQFYQNKTLLHTAAETGNLCMVEYLVDEGFRPNERSNDGSLPLHFAVRYCHLNVLKYFLRSSNLEHSDILRMVDIVVEINFINPNQFEVLQYLLENNLNVNLYDFEEPPFLHKAVLNNNEGLVIFLLKNGAFYNVRDSLFDMTPLEISDDENVINVLELVNKLFSVVKYDDYDSLVNCISQGALINVRNEYNHTPLFYAAELGYESITTYLLENNADPNCLVCHCAPLHIAAKNSHWNVVNILLSYGAIYNSKTILGKTPLNFAEDNFPSADRFLIIRLLNVIDYCFLGIQKGDINVIKTLNNLASTIYLKSVMKAKNGDNHTLVVVAMISNFKYIEKLKEIGQKYRFSHVEKHYSQLLASENYEKALALLTNIEQERSELLGVTNPGTLDIKQLIADIWYKQMRYKEAHEKYKEIYENRQIHLGIQAKDTLIVYARMASTFHACGDHKKAMSILEEVLNIQKDYSVSDPLIFQCTQSQKALLLENQEKYKDALLIYNEILGYPTSGNELFILNGKHGKARIFGKQKKYVDSLNIYEECIKEMKTRYGSLNSLTLKTSREMAIILMKERKFEEGLKLLTLVLGIQLSIFGPEYPDTLITHQNIAKAYFIQGQYIRAFKIYKETFSRLQSFLGPDNSDVLNSKRYIEKISLILNFNVSYGAKLVQEIESNIGNGNGVEALWSHVINVSLKENLKQDDGWSFLHCAAVADRKDAVEILLKNGADIMCVNQLGETALHISATKHHLDIIQLLLQSVENNHEMFYKLINAKTKIGDTALHAACNCSTFYDTSYALNTVKCLLDYGAIYNIQNDKSEKPIDITKDEGIKYLLSKIEH